MKEKSRYNVELIRKAKIKTIDRKCNICKKEFKSKNKFFRFCDTCRRGISENNPDNTLPEHKVIL